MVAAHRGYLRPTGQWNFEEVTVKGPKIKVELNGTVILDTDLSKVKEFMANSAIPGKDRTSGFFGFAGHTTRSSSAMSRSRHWTEVGRKPRTGRRGRRNGHCP